MISLAVSPSRVFCRAAFGRLPSRGSSVALRAPPRAARGGLIVILRCGLRPLSHGFPCPNSLRRPVGLLARQGACCRPLHPSQATNLPCHRSRCPGCLVWHRPRCLPLIPEPPLHRMPQQFVNQSPLISPGLKVGHQIGIKPKRHHLLCSLAMLPRLACSWLLLLSVFHNAESLKVSAKVNKSINMAKKYVNTYRVNSVQQTLN